MKQHCLLLVSLGIAIPASAQDICAARNGDVNADGAVDVTDAITIPGHLFLGNPAQLSPHCPRHSGLPDTGQTKCYDNDGNVIDCTSEAYPGRLLPHGLPGGGPLRR